MSPRRILPSPPRAPPWHPLGTPFPAALVCPVLHITPVLIGWLLLPGTPGCVCGKLPPAEDRLHVGWPQPTWDGLVPHSPAPVCPISSLSLGTSPEPVPWEEAGVAGREGRSDGVAGTPHLSSAHSCSWDLAAALTGGHRAHPDHQTRGQGPRSCLRVSLSLQCISPPAFGPSAPS